jgi:hypothetical protein
MIPTITQKINPISRSANIFPIQKLKPAVIVISKLLKREARY